jgi:hypothetical protein
MAAANLNVRTKEREKIKVITIIINKKAQNSIARRSPTAALLTAGLSSA